ncbi:hypothetical protein [Humibacter ginsenosidimutans]|uniref:HK97 gp10 family phage protein n=1 Tax=Humibacter ginsenosidimutans TaxID=2599293 RepID=A0A5B8M5A4_9MICO|nr:hypothetical protein [Humibacter ginsenosidimutans]QDZ14762.1 hypothetical protein FPZ11_08325 [Humibacter ginsenosidimutans]
MRGVDADARRHLFAAARQDATPIWKEELAERATTRLQSAVLVRTAKVAVTARNIQFKSATAGKLSTGTAASTLAAATEFGMSPGSYISTHSPKGKSYLRRAGSAFGPRKQAGKVVFPAVDDAIPRVTSLVIQTCGRSLYDALDGKTN